MKPEIKTKWLEALRSGEFRQGKQYLRLAPATNQPEDQFRYCCLGVLCELHRRETAEARWKLDHDHEWVYRGSVYALPDQVLEWAELEAADPEVDGEELSRHNDGFLDKDEHQVHGKSFTEIADLIEKHL